MEVVDGRHVGQSQGGWSYVGTIPECEVIHRDPITPPSRCTALDMVGLLGKALTRDTTRRLRFVVHAAGYYY